MSQRTPHPEQRQDHKLASDARRDSRDHANTTVHRQSTNANAARSESEEQGHGQRQRQQGQRHGQGCKERTVQESKERRSETSHVKAECGKRLKDLADAEEKLVAATTNPNDTATVVPLQCFLPDERHPSTIIIAMTCANNETSCNSSSEQTVMRPGAGSIAPAETQSCEKDPSVAKLEKHRGVYWLPCSRTKPSDGAPLCPNPKAARLAIEAPPISEQVQRRWSWERVRRALPANVSKEEFDGHQLTHLPFRSWCDHCVRSKAVEDAHRPRIDPHRAESQDWCGLRPHGEGNGSSACEGGVELSGFSVGCSLLSHGGERR